MKSALDDLIELVNIPSLSGEEDAAADWIEKRLKSSGISTNRFNNNIWVISHYYEAANPTVLLNSHLDTVKPGKEWTVPPFQCTKKGNQLIGLGINDAGASLIGLLHTFLHFQHQQLPFNLVFCASAEEENSGVNGFESIRNQFGKIDMAIVGEPTGGKVAIAEKGLLVIDAVAKGVAGHAARNTGKNAIYKALEDIERIRSYCFTNFSDLLGPVNINVTTINSGTQHNVIPDECRFTIDVRLNECYTHEQIMQELQAICTSKLVARSTRLSPSHLPAGHVLQKTATALQLDCYGSPTMSDQALMPWPSIKLGIGESERSHTADEYIYEYELERGILQYKAFIKQLQHEIMG